MSGSDSIISITGVFSMDDQVTYLIENMSELNSLCEVSIKCAIKVVTRIEN